jgi:hypothetical protein
MPLLYSQCVKAFFSSVAVCGVVYLLDYHQLAGFLLMVTGLIGLVVTTGSFTGWIDVLKDGRTLPQAVLVSQLYSPQRL